MNQQETNQLIAQAIITTQHVLATLTAQRQMPIGAVLLARIVWPQTHENEIYVLLGPNEQAILAVEPLSADAAKRMQSFAGQLIGFQHWAAIQTWHEQAALSVSTQAKVLRQASSGILVPS